VILLDQSKNSWRIELDGESLLLYWESSGLAFCGVFSSNEISSTKPKELQSVFESPTDIKIVGSSRLISKLSSAKWFEALSVSRKIVIDGQGCFVFVPHQRRLLRHKVEELSQVEPSVKSVSKNGHEALGKIQKEIYRVLIVDDSSTIRTLLKKILKANPCLEVVAAVEHPKEVEGAIEKFKPDVVTLDIHMPEMNGVEVLKKIVAPRGIPAVMISSVKMEEGPLVLEALNSGAIDYIEKPALRNLASVADDINKRVLSAARADTSALKNSGLGPVRASSFGQSVLKDGLVLIGSSTGGTQALQNVLQQLPDQIPPILVVQHIPGVFSKALADRLNELVKFEVVEAVDGQRVEPNCVYIAPGGRQMALRVSGDFLRLDVNDDEPVNRFKPSVDYLFNSVPAKIRKKVVAGILTGMGRDGAAGLLRLKDELGARTFGQDEASSVVYGMPKAAFELGAVEKQCSLSKVSSTIAGLFSEKQLKKAS